MSFKNLIFSIVVCLLFVSCGQHKDPNVRLTKTINSDWTFNYFPQSEPDTSFVNPGFDDSTWEAIALPHTWSTYETTEEVHPFIYNASERDDPYWWYGWGVYRKKFSPDNSLRDKKLFAEFDGVQKYSKVYLNGQYLGDHKGGFTSFYVDLTDYIEWDNENVLVVVVSNRRNDKHQIPPMTAGNWNVYGGIYRDVRMVVKNRVYIPYQGSYKHEGGTFVTTPKVTGEIADVNVRTYIKNEMEKNRNVELQTSIINPDGEEILKEIKNMEIASGDMVEFKQDFKHIQNPSLWSPDEPTLYNVISKVYVNNQLVDEYESPLGFRYFHWDYENDDFYINGEKMNILGVNRHQEYPWLGDAHPKWITRMDMEDMKYNLGHNFMRLTHYPNDKYLYQLADSFGIAMVEEVPNIKSIDFNEEVQEQNVRSMIRRDRNHPSIMFWSMGNETHDAADSKWAVEEDTTRIIHLRKGHRGGDYIEHTHENLDMENLLRVTVRGWFTEEDSPEGFSSNPENGQHTSNETWQHQMARVRGGSVRGLLGDNCVAWLYEDHGADREYKNCILKHINPKGWVDMYRQPKYLYWLTKAYYTDIPTVFIHPHYWRKQYEGQKKDIQVDSNCDEVELFVNGESVDVKTSSADGFYTETFENITIEEGALKAIGRIDGSQYIHEVIMPGEPAKLKLTTDQKTIKANRSGISIVLADILDENDNPVFDATNTLTWSVSGPATLVGAPTYETDIMKFEEMEGTGYTVPPVANVIRSTNEPGEIKVTVTSKGLDPAEIIIQSVEANDRVTWLNEPRLSDGERTEVRRDPNFKREMEEIPLTMIPIKENHTIKGKNLEEYKYNVDDFVGDRNRGAFETYEAYPYFVEAVARRVQSNDGNLIADDYNFLVNQYNAVVVIEDFIDNLDISSDKKKQLKQQYAKEVLIEGNQIDVTEELRKLRSQY